MDAPTLKKWFRWMLKLRLLDARMMNLQRQGRIGFYGACTGQEAAVIGSAAALDPMDWVFPALREGGVALYRGMPLSAYVAQLFGNSRDACHGRQLPCHYADPERRFVSMSSCIGTQIPHAVGAAMAARYRRHPAVVMGYLGDGATSEGDVHAGFNFAGVYKAPVVFFCQNNQWAITVPVRLQTASESIAVKATAYGFEGVQVDGNDVLEVYGAAKRAVDKARTGGGPTLIEAVTYRMGGHSSSDDPSRYRDEREVKAWEGRDPIRRLRERLEAEGGIDAGVVAEMEEEIRAEIDAAVRLVESAPPPAVDTLFTDVYARRNAHVESTL